MTPERWQRIRELLHGAMELAAAERSVFLDSKCSNDPVLRREVESFLSAEGEVSREFLERPITDSISVAPGSRLGPYEIVAFIGAGGMGEVYKARDTRLDRTVAIKVLPAHLSSSSQHIERLQREAKAISALQHPNICTLHDVGQQDNSQYLVMEYLEGETLAERLTKGRLPLDLTLRYATEVADALEAAHRRGVVHRDLKPGNIFLTTHGESKVLDFGLAKLEDSRPATNSATTLTSDPKALTTPGVAMGTVAYMSPEQARGEELDARTDIFSLGAVLYEMATGKLAFPGKTSAVVFKGILDEAPPAPSQIVPSLPASLDQIVEKALEKDRDLRYQNAVDLRADLQRLKRDAGPARVTTRLQIATKGRLGKSGKVIVPVVVALVVLVAARYFHFDRTKELSDKDTIVLADFTNTTGDPVFDGSLRQGLSVQLEQSPFLNLLTEAQIQQTLRLMGMPPDSRLTPGIATEICQRNSGAAVLDGSIVQIGTTYNLILKAVNCSNGVTLTSAAVQASDKNHVLEGLGKAASDMRKDLGESLASIQRFDTPLEQVSTSSLEALKAYSLGWKLDAAEGDSVRAVAFYEQATKLDPKFAAAYMRLGHMYWNLGYSFLAAENIRQAFELREGVSEREKLFIEASYHHFVTGDLVKALQVYDVWAQTYPRDPFARNQRANANLWLGRYDEALADIREAHRLNPARARYYDNLVTWLVNVDRFDEAHAVAEEAKAKNLEIADLSTTLYVLAFLQNDSEGMKEQVAFSARKPWMEDELLEVDADIAAYFGRLQKARTLSRQAITFITSTEPQAKETAARYELNAALKEAVFGNADAARQRVDSALRLSNGAARVQYGAALTLALIGEAVRAQKLADDLGKRFPEDTLVQYLYLPTVNAQLALTRHDTQKAIEALQTVAPYELGGPSLTLLYPAYIRGLIYLAAHRGDEAAPEFQKILDHRGIVQNEPIGALAHLQLGRAYAMQGDGARARSAYQDFLTLWKDADPDIPILKQAKVEYAKLI